MEIKRCSRCKNDKPLEAFAKDKSSKDGRGGWCKECNYSYRKDRGFNLYSYRKKYSADYQKKLRQTKKHKNYEREYRAKYESTFPGVVTSLLCGARYRAKRDKLHIDIDREWIVERLTPMACEATGVDLILQTNHSVSHTPFKPSVDRIDNAKGYTKENCRIVAVIYNKAKSDYTDEDVMRMANALVQKSALQPQFLE